MFDKDVFFYPRFLYTIVITIGTFEWFIPDVSSNMWFYMANIFSLITTKTTNISVGTIISMNGSTGFSMDYDYLRRAG